MVTKVGERIEWEQVVLIDIYVKKVIARILDGIEWMFKNDGRSSCVGYRAWLVHFMMIGLEEGRKEGDEMAFKWIN